MSAPGRRRTDSVGTDRVGTNSIARGISALAILGLAVPATGLLVSFPLWYLATRARGVYTVVAGLVVAGLVISHVVRKARRAG
ncbi:MAG: hypothetical protein ACOCW3_05525 [Spirochaetota bacterium]